MNFVPSSRLRHVLEGWREPVSCLAELLCFLTKSGRAFTRRRTSAELNGSCHPPVTTPQRSLAVPDNIFTYAELQQEIHQALRVQHPEWVQSNGDSPCCDAYDARFAEILKRCPPPGGLTTPLNGERKRTVPPLGVLSTGQNTTWKRTEIQIVDV